MTNRKFSVHIVLCFGICILTALKYLFQTILFLIPLLAKETRFGQEAVSLGIIGGSDGPTAIFLSVSNVGAILTILELLGAIYVSIVLILCHRRFTQQGRSLPD